MNQLEQVKQTSVIDVWQSDYLYYQNVDNREFCNQLKLNWFQELNYWNYKKTAHLSSYDLQKIKNFVQNVIPFVQRIFFIL